MMATMRVRAGWPRALEGMLLLCIGIGLVSLVLPEEPEATGYYDGDEDDVAATPERAPLLVPPAATRRLASLPVPAAAVAALRADTPSPPAPGRSQPPLLRSPPA
jgi:hypothetical protein